jgi:hypothetical protein
MSEQIANLLQEWLATLTPKEKALHELAAVALKKNLVTEPSDKDNGSYFPEKSHAFRAWMKAKRYTATNAG